MKVNIEKRITVKEMTVEVEITQYFAVIKRYNTKMELCKVIESTKVEKPIHEDYYNKLNQQFKENNGKPIYYSPSVVDGYNDKVVRVYTKKSPQRKNLLIELDSLIERKSLKKALKIIDLSVSTLEAQIASYNEITKDTFVDNWNYSIKHDLDILKQKTKEIESLELKKMESREKRALNKLKKAYKTLLTEKEKYSDAYFEKLLNQFCEEQGVSIDYLLSL